MIQSVRSIRLVVRLSLLVCSWLTLSSLVGCAPSYTAVKPEGFAAYKGNKPYRAISPDGVVYEVREVKNEPYAELSFWKEAMKKRMDDAGYRVIQDTTMTIGNREAAYIELAAPMGERDYLYLVTITTNEKKIIIAEAAGVVQQVQNRKQAIIDAIEAIGLD